VGDWPLLPVVLAALLVYGGRWVLQTVSAGWTAVHANRSLNRHASTLARITKGVR
jgi:hypothetical protein